MHKVLIVGAGMLGKGFLGEVFDAAEGWQVAFLDKDPRVIENLKRPEGYTVECSRVDRTDHRVITDYEAYLTDAECSCADYLIDCDVMMMPLYPEDFDEAIAYLGAPLSRRSRENPDRPLDIVLNTNYNHYVEHIEAAFYAALDGDEARAWFAEKVYVRDSIIRRATLAETNYDTHLRSEVMASLLVQPPLHNDLSGVEWMEEADHIELLKDMKVYTVNGMHATCAYAGYLKGYDTIEDAMADPEVSALVDGVMEEACHGLTHEFPITPEEIVNMAGFMKLRLQTPIYDAIFRVAWDPVRKIARQDRLTGSAVYCYEHGREPVCLMQSMANLFAYDEPRDPKAMEIQAYIREHGIDAAAPHYMGLPASHPLVQGVIFRYRQLKK